MWWSVNNVTVNSYTRREGFEYMLNVFLYGIENHFRVTSAYGINLSRLCQSTPTNLSIRGDIRTVSLDYYKYMWCHVNNYGVKR